MHCSQVNVSHMHAQCQHQEHIFKCAHMKVYEMADIAFINYYCTTFINVTRPFKVQYASLCPTFIAF